MFNLISFCYRGSFPYILLYWGEDYHLLYFFSNKWIAKTGLLQSVHKKIKTTNNRYHKSSLNPSPTLLKKPPPSNKPSLFRGRKLISSLRKHPFLLAFRRRGRFARRNVCGRNSILMTQSNVYIINPVVMGFQIQICPILRVFWLILGSLVFICQWAPAKLKCFF